MIITYWIITLHVIVLPAIDTMAELPKHGRFVCVKPTLEYNNETEEDSCEEWFSIVSSPKRYFTSHTHIRVLPGVYHINSTYNLSVINVTNFSITGSGKTAVTIKCASNKVNEFMHIINSSFVEIRCIKFVACGGEITPTQKKKVFPSTAGTSMYLQNVNSVKLSNVSFENSHGHGILGVNVMGYSFFSNITVFLSELRKSRVYSGGIILLYINTTCSEIKSKQNVLIKNLQIFNINSINQITWNVYKATVYDSTVTSAAAIGIIFNQHNFSVNVAIAHAYISNITSKTGPIVYASYNSSNAGNSINISNTIIDNNTNDEEHPNIKVIISITPQKHSYMIENTYLELHHCTFSFNKAKSNNFVIQYANKFTGHEYYRNTSFTLKLISTSFTGNKAVNKFLQVNSIEQVSSCFISIEGCTFTFNDDFTTEINECSNVLLKSNKFYNNSVSVMEHGVLAFDRSYPTFEGNNEFFDNTANIILAFYEYVLLKEGATINISHNTATLDEVNTIQTQLVKALIYFKTIDGFQLPSCAFQFLSDHNQTDQLTFNYKVIFHHNQNYSSVIYGALLNSCHWLKNTAFKYFNSNFVYKRIPNLNSSSFTTLISRQKSTIYFCNDDNQVEYFKDKFQPIFPGQNIPVHLILLPPFLTTVIYSVNFTTDRSEYTLPYKPCEIQAYQIGWLYLVQTNCTSISYKVYSNTFEQCFVSFRTTYPDDSLYIYYIEFKTCPLGFSLRDRSCQCDSGLEVAFPDIKCDIESNTITRPGGSWIGSTGKDGQQVILYTKYCTVLFCNKLATDVQLEFPDTQCVNNRAGIACGHCSPGLDALFGSLKCAKCSNIWLLLLPVFILAGLVLVLVLFALNLTVVEGMINGFIFYINVIVGNAYIYDIFPPSFISIPTSLFNLELGIETCFYHGMTEYHKTWLQFAFPSYLLFIVAVLAFASRYSSSVEKLTRRRVIPVITTIFLLSYSKILLVTIKVLFSYTNMYSLPDNKKTVLWKWDSSIRLFGPRFSILFLVCLVVLLLVLLPLILLLIFTKHFYCFNFVVKYLKPYLDAFQAPFKDNHRYYPGVELIIRNLSFMLGNDVINASKVQALSNLLCVLLLVYLCAFKPFKHLSKTIFYTTFILNTQCIIILSMYTKRNVESITYIVLFTTLILIAFTEFAGIILYSLYINYLYKIECFHHFIMEMKRIIYKVIFRNEDNEMLDIYEHYQEELLAMDPLH